MARRFTVSGRRLAAAAATVALAASLTAGTALAGEVTGTGKLIDMHGKSACAFSGQEDLQYFTTDEDTQAKDVVTRGDPAHAQSWGQIPKAMRDQLAAIGLHPGDACNPTKPAPEEP